MAVAARLSMIGENGYGEPEKDANSVLMDLDKGLRSPKLGEQCESIVRFPRLFEKYPFPILINSAFLKLADVFRVGSNFLRLCVLKVTQQSVRHLDKILNIDEFLRRIFSVMHSNDPVARAITLRTLGSVACIISEKKNVHHSIHSGLDSHDSVETEAAIIASIQFSAQSKTFAVGIFSKLAEMIQGLATPVEMKIKLIPVFQHMHHDSNTAMKVRELCVKLLPSFPAQAFVLTTLTTLTKLSAHALFNIPQQIELLLSYVQKDPRRAVKIRCLQDLHLLARKGPHMWTVNNIEKLCSFTLSTPYAGLKIGALCILSSLSSSIAASHFCMKTDGLVMQVCQECCYHNNLEIASKTTQMLTNLAIHAAKDGEDVNSALIQEACSTLEAMISIASCQDTDKELHNLKTCLLSASRICLACPSLTDRFVDTMMTCLSSVSGKQAALLCECLAAVSGYQNDLLQNLVPDIIAVLERTVMSDPATRCQQLVVPLSTLLFQASVGNSLSDEVLEVLDLTFQHIDHWLVFKIARQAARYGHHGIASQKFKELTSKVSTEQLYFWLSALHSFCKAEESLGAISCKSSQFIEKVTEAELHYYKGISSLKAASTPNFPLEFQCQYGRLRVQMFQAHTQMTKACSSFKTNPPPAIASSLAIATGLDLHRCGHVVAQLLKCGRQFQDVSRGYGDLYQVLFDADPGTLIHIQLLQQCCSLIAYVIDVLLNNTTNRASGEFDSNAAQLVAGDNPVIEHQGFIEAGKQVVKLLHDTIAIKTDSPLSYQHIECLQKSASLLLQVPLCLPRFFFQELQSTGIKLAISPQPRSQNEPITVQNETHLTLKVEGVIQHGSQSGIFRKVHQVHLSVNSTLQSRMTIPGDLSKPKDNPTNEMKQTADPHNDYFSGQFLLAFPVAGIHSVNVEAAIMDQNGRVWKTGPRTTLTVKSYDEQAQRQQQQQYANRPRQTTYNF